jgi:prolyl oligopeptidase
VLAWVSLGVERNRLLFMADMKDAQAGRAQWRRLVDGADQISDLTLGQHQGQPVVYLRSAKGAPRFQVLRLSLAQGDLAKADVVVPHGEGVITSMSGARDALYLTRRMGVNTGLWRLAHDGGALEEVTLPLAGTVDLRQASSTQDGVIARVSAWTRAGTDYRWDPARKTATPLVLAHVGAFDAPSGIQAREVMVRSHDGVMVPASILARSDIKLDGSNPTLLYGYGAYGSVESPGYSPTRLAWLERGGIYVFAHVRGGGVLGDDWYRAGHKTTKPNTWKDGIAVAEWLIANGYTSRQKLGINGGSAGGIFVGRAITERPDLFAAAVPAVPVLDTVRSEQRANGVANVPEYGTVAKEDEFRGLLAMSSYHALKPGTQYPAVLLTHGVNDIRVDVWQSAKFAARLAATGSAKPVLMLLDYEAGHGAGSSRLQAQERQASVWAFLLWQFGVKEFQPPVPG